MEEKNIRRRIDRNSVHLRGRFAATETQNIWYLGRC